MGLVFPNLVITAGHHAEKLSSSSPRVNIFKSRQLFVFVLLLLPPPPPPPAFFLPLFFSLPSPFAAPLVGNFSHAGIYPPGHLLSHDEGHKTREAIPKSALSSRKSLAFLIPSPKDTLDLFATLVVSLELSNHKQFFRTFPNSFTTFVLSPLS